MKPTTLQISRRAFLAAIGFTMSSIFLTKRASASISGPKAPTLESIYSMLNSMSAGKHDATNVIQMLIDLSTAQAIPARVPPGKYLINPDKGLIMHSDSHLVLATNTQLVSMPSSKPGYGIIRLYHINNATVTGGSIIGEREAHLGRDGEWGMGVDIRGSNNILIADITVTGCWGDGFYIGKGPNNNQPCRNITLEHVIATNNRRQGLSIVACDGAKITNSKFENTSGTPPSAGIDIEPNAGDSATNVVIQNCELINNSGAGIETRTHADGVTITDCTIAGNTQGGILLLNKSKNINIKENTISNSRGSSIHIGKDVQNHSIINNNLHPTFLGKGLHIDH